MGEEKYTAAFQILSQKQPLRKYPDAFAESVEQIQEDWPHEIELKNQSRLERFKTHSLGQVDDSFDDMCVM